jgi:hypothetical protein
MLNRKRAILIALVLLSCAALFACGSDDVSNVQTAAEAAAKDVTDEAKAATDEAEDEAKTATDKVKDVVEDRPGDPAVWERIEQGTDCAALQEEFDQAMDNAERREPGDPLRELSLSYAKAADQRMKDIGCY